MSILLIVAFVLIGLMFLCLMVGPVLYWIYRWRQVKNGLGAETFMDWIETEYHKPE